MLGGDGFELRGFVAAAEEQHLTAFVGEQSGEPACVFDGPYLASVLGEGGDADGGWVLVGVEGDGVGVERGGVDGEAGQTAIAAEGSAKVSVSGLSDDGLEVKGAGSANIDCLKLETRKADIVLTGATLVEAASDEISVDLSGRSTLVFDGDPLVKIVSVKTSTITRHGAAK